MNDHFHSPRMFDNPILEFLSRSPWYFVPMVWLPVSLGCLFYDATTYHHSWQFSVGLVILGTLAWTLTEYTMHRFVFHWQPDSPWGKRFHFIIHGVHHDWPNDAWRLVMPLSTSLLISVPFAALFYFTLGNLYFFPFFSGFLIGYIYYEITHYTVHHLKWDNAVFKAVKRHHLEHHHSRRHQGRKFGVSSPLWDIVFNTN